MPRFRRAAVCALLSLAAAPALAQERKGKYLIPGLAEMHAHIPGAKAPGSYVEQVLFLYVSAGITTIRGMLGDPRHLELRDRAARNELVSPTIYAAGPSLNGTSLPRPPDTTCSRSTRGSRWRSSTPSSGRRTGSGSVSRATCRPKSDSRGRSRRRTGRSSTSTGTSKR